MSLKPRVSWRGLGDVLQCWQTAQRRAEDCAFVWGCYSLIVKPTKGKAGCLCEKKRWLGFEMGLCRTANPTGVWAQTALQDGDKAAAGQKDRHLKSHQICKCLLLTKTKRDWFWIQLVCFEFHWKLEMGNQSWPLWLGNTGGQPPLPETPREGAKLHLHRPQGSEELQTETISMCRAVLMCVPRLNLYCKAGGLHGVLQGAGPPVTQMRRPTGAHHSSLPAHMHSFPSKDALKRLMCTQVPAWHVIQIHSFKSAKDQDCKVLTRVWEVPIATAW